MLYVDEVNNREAADFLDLIVSYSLEQHVTGSTHKNGHTLDLVLTRSWDSLVLSAVPEDHGFPDHYPVLSQLAVAKPKLPQQKVTYRKVKAIDIDTLSDAISNSSLFSKSLSALTLVELTDLYDTELRDILDRLAPIKTRTITIRPESEWYNSEIRAAKQQRRQAERLWRKTGLTVHREIFMEKRMDVNTLIGKSKVEHYKTLISEHQGDIKHLFRIVNSLLGKSSSSPLPSDKTSTELVGMFSDFFVEKITKIRNSIPTVPRPLEADFPSNSCRLMNFNLVLEEDVLKLITSSRSKSCDLDPLPTELVKKAAHKLCPAITTIINKSLSSGVFPTGYKLALVTPLLKKPTLDPENLKNFRPVSNLAFLSKILEKVVAAQINQYLAENNLLEPYQSAYRQGHSTETALMRVQNDIICAIGEQRAVLFVMLDLSAAFDTVDHETLLEILQHLGIGETVLDWFSSYLTNRQQRISVKQVTSDVKQLDCGVPQGSVIGPILFTIYTTSLGHMLREKCVSYHLYADDTQLWITFKPKDIDNAIIKIESCVESIHSWMCQHQLKMNSEKTEFLVNSSKRMSTILNNPSLKVGDQSVSPSSTAKNLGITIDSHASMKAHISAICRSSYIHIYNINKLKKYLDRISLENIIPRVHYDTT